MRGSLAIGILAALLVFPLGQAGAQTSVTLPPAAPPPIPPALVPGPGTPNPFASLPNPGSTRFQQGVANPQNNPHPMLPWGDGQIGGERYGQVIRYWEQRAQVVENVILVVITPEEEATPEAKPEAPPETKPETSPQVQPAAQPATIRATDARIAKAPQPQSITVPASWIIETTRGYIHLPRWVLQERGGDRYQWALVGAWFQPR